VGHVTAISGEVSAQRANQEARLLHINETVFADDTIVTKADSKIEIRLTHNGAIWALEENSERRVDKGLAYRATKKGKAPLNPKEQVATSAAGRGTGREAADSSETFVQKEKDSPAPSPTSERSRRTRSSAEPATKGDRRSEMSSGETSKRPRPSRQEKLGKIIGTEISNTPAIDRNKFGGMQSGANSSPPRDQDVGDEQSSPIVPPPAAKSKPSPPPAPDDGMDGSVSTANPLKATQQAFVAAMVRKCHDQHGGTGRMTYGIDAAGAFTATLSDSSLAAVVTCVQETLRTDHLPNKTTFRARTRF